MKKFLTKNLALEKYNLSHEQLDKLISNGIVTAYELESCNDDPKLIVYNDDLANYLADQKVKPEQFLHLRNSQMSLNQASRKYEVYSATVSSWVKKGLISYQVEKNKKLVNEADVAYLVALSKAKKIRQGRRFVPPDKLPSNI